MKKAISIFVAVLFVFGLLSICGCSTSSPLDYNASIAEGRAAAGEIMTSTGASSLSVAFVDGRRLVWAETFVPEGKAPMTVPAKDTMYCIGSVSKMLATIAVMILVDRELVSLDAPLVRYIPSFSMLSPEYTQITVKMLINHSAGFPGADWLNESAVSPLGFSYAAQVQQTIRTQRLKHSPGYMNVYSNEGFTMIEQLVPARTGKSYTQFVQDEILEPLGMNHSRYALDYFPEGSFADLYKDGARLPQMFVNSFASGGLYSTPADMARIAMMLIGGGKLDGRRILSRHAVAAMGVDQTQTGFNPVRPNAWRFGLGWDTVHQPGLAAVGVAGWQKSGDVVLNGSGYGAVMIVAPREALAVIVLGASGSFGSGAATVIAERMLLRALVEKGRIASMPQPLELSPLPLKTPDPGQLDAVCGDYANNDTLLRVQKESADALAIARYDAAAAGWKSQKTGLKLRSDDRYANDADPSQSFSFKIADARQYLIYRSAQGYRHYQDDLIYAERVAAATPMPAPWSNRLGRTWLVTNDHPDSDVWDKPRMQLGSVDHLLVADTGWLGLRVVDPLVGASRAGMMLMIPHDRGRNLDDVVIEIRGGEEWIRFGSYLYRPGATVPVLVCGSNSVSIVADGVAQWRLLDAAGVKTVTIRPSTGSGRWVIYDGVLQRIESGTGLGSITLPAGVHYLLFHSSADVLVI
ncbi:MAG: beta-lactamase family protein [Deltaproteobacteria bacterium]